MRRALVFTDWDAVAKDVQTLSIGYYVQLGRWSLAQTCDHLALWTSYPVDGYPVSPLPWLVRATMGRWFKWRVLHSRRGMPARVPTLPQTVSAPGGAAEPAIAKFTQAIERFHTHTGEFVPSPLMGPLTRAECERVCLIHAAHHLSFLLPKVV
jgi:hypothetical protein